MPLSRRAELSSDLPVQFHGFGDSISAAYGVNPTTELYLAKTATAKGYTLVNHAISASMASDQAYLAYGVSPTDRHVYSWCLGINDADQYGTNVTKRDSGFINFLRGGVVWCALPRKVIATDMTKTGTWSKTPVNSIGMSAAASGATAAATVSGTAVYVFGIIQNSAGSEGAANVKVDGSIVGSIAMVGTSIGNTILGQSYSLACWRFGGLSSGSHAVQVVTTNSNTFFLDAIAGSDQPESPLVLVGDVSNRASAQYTSPNSDANTQNYCSAISTMVSQLQADGLNVRAFNVNSVINQATELQDGIHWTVAGHNDVYLQQVAVIP